MCAPRKYTTFIAEVHILSDNNYHYFTLTINIHIYDSYSVIKSLTDLDLIIYKII